MKTNCTPSAKTRKTQTRSTLTEAKAQELLEMLKAAPASITEDAIDAIEAAHAKDTFGAARRAALIILLRPGAVLIDMLEHADHQQALAIAMLYEHQMKYLGALHELIKLIETATTRTMMALCYRPDCDAIFAGAAVEIAQEAQS